MPFLPVPLPSDVLLWLLVAAVAGYGRYCSRRPHLALPWRRVFTSKAAVSCTVMLAFFVLLGLADSVHFRLRLPASPAETGAQYSPEVLSVLDVALSDLRLKRERTYSAPLATRLYSKELLEAEEGKIGRASCRERV